MRGSVYKQCKVKGCRGSPKCAHPWWMTFSHKGKRYRVSVDLFAKAPVTNKSDAERTWLPKFSAAVMEGRWPEAIPTDGEAITVADSLKLYRKRHCEAEKLNMTSLGSKLNVLERRFGHLPIRTLEKPDPIEDFKLDLIEAELANSTINRYLAQLKHWIGWNIGRHQMTTSPFYHKTRNPTGIRLLRGENKRRRRLISGEERRLLDACRLMNVGRHDFVGPLMEARIHAALDLGLRRGEMLKTMNGDVDWRPKPDSVLTIRWGNAKSRKERQIPVTSQRVRKFLRARRVVGGPEGHPFGSTTGELVESFRHAWETVLRLSGITDPAKGIDGDLHWHDLRHECGSRYADNGMDARHIQMLLGHADLKTTERYLNSDTKRLAEAMKRAAGGA
jgi:integrase